MCLVDEDLLEQRGRAGHEGHRPLGHLAARLLAPASAAVAAAARVEEEVLGGVRVREHDPGPAERLDMPAGHRRVAELARVDARVLSQDDDA